MARDARLQRLLLAWPLCGAAMGVFTAQAHATGLQTDAPLLVYIGLIWLPLVVGTVAWQGPSRAAFSAGCQGAACATMVSAGLAMAGVAVSLLVSALLGHHIASHVAVLGALTAFLAVGVGAAFTPIRRTTKRHIAAAATGWILGLFAVVPQFLLLVAILPAATTPAWLSAFALGCVFCTPAFTSIALQERLLALPQR
jgi:hypothetical protein